MSQTDDPTTGGTERRIGVYICHCGGNISDYVDVERVVAAVEAAGLRQLVLDSESWPEVLESLRVLGRTLGEEGRAERVAAELQAEVDGLRRAFARPPRVAVEWWPRPIIVAGARSWVTDMLRDLGAENAFAGRDVRSTPVTADEWRAAAPDLIVVSWCGVKKLRPEIAAARGLSAPVVAIPESGLGRPGPRLIEGHRALARALAAFP